MKITILNVEFTGINWEKVNLCYDVPTYLK